MSYSTSFWIPPTKRQCIEWLLRYYGDKYGISVFRAKKIKELQGWISGIRKSINR